MSDDELPGMWERADFEGGVDTVREGGNPCVEMVPDLADYGPHGGRALHALRRDYAGEQYGEDPRPAEERSYEPPAWLGWFAGALLVAAVAALVAGVVWLSRAAEAIGPHAGLVCG